MKPVPTDPVQGQPRVGRPGRHGFLRAIGLPLFFSAYPVMALLAHNASEMRVSAGWRALLVSVGVAYLLLLILRVLLKDWPRAAVLCALLLFLFFSYGHVYDFLEKNPVLGITFGRHRLLAPLWLALAVFVSWWAARRLHNVTVAMTALQWFGIAALVFPMVQLISFHIRLSIADQEANRLTAATPGLHYTRGAVPPNIYYIILDAYARGDVLEKELNFDNTAFLNELEQMGLYVADCSQSNYAQTELSLASALNYDYLQSLDQSLIPGNQDRSHLWPMIRKGRVRQTLEALGYTIVAFETGFSWSELRDVDVFYTPAKLGLAGMETLGGLSDFEALLLKTSGGLLLADAGSSLPKAFTPDLSKAQGRKRERILYTFSKLKSSQLSDKSPKFVFAHIVLPHFPYVFGPEGQEVYYPDKIDPSTYQRAYTDQVAFLNRRIPGLVREIIEGSSTPPIIIIQADHGHDRASRESRMKILNAYYLPDGGKALLYPTISPVNTFRVIMNYYFGEDFPLLEDTSYFSTYQASYEFQVIPNDTAECKGN